MENHSSIIRGLINDLMHSLTAALVHVDDLIMKLDRKSDSFSDAWLTNEQLGRSIELFLELRLASHYFNESLFKENDQFSQNSQKSISNLYKHKLNEVITAILGSCDLLLMDKNNKQIDNKIMIIHNSLNKYQDLIESFNENTDNIFNKSDKQERVKLIPIKNTQKITSSKKIPKKILLVEDDDEVRRVNSLALENNGYSLFECASGQSANNIFTRGNHKFNLCIIDLGLPDINGDQLAKEFLSQNNTLKILFTTGQDEAYLKEHYDINGRFDLLKKPYRIAKLINKVDEALL